MFSFWSNDEDENTEQSNESDEEKDKTGKPERFSYVKKDERNTSNCPDNVFQNNRSVNAFKEKRKQMDDMLKDVWSVRKDVRVNNAVKASDIGQKSYYSRHGGISGLHTETNYSKDLLTGGSSKTKTWSVPRQGYSYSDNITLNQGDILGETTTPDINLDPPGGPSENRDTDIHRQNIVNTLKHGVSGPNVTTRELSARTKRAQKFNNAYLRSTGMGKYTPHMTNPTDHHDNHKKHWNS